MSSIQRTDSTPVSRVGYQPPARPKNSEVSQNSQAEPQDRVTLSSEDETYHRASTRQIFKALQGLHHPEPPQEPSPAEKKKALKSMSDMVLKDYTDYARGPR